MATAPKVTKKVTVTKKKGPKGKTVVTKKKTSPKRTGNSSSKFPNFVKDSDKKETAADKKAAAKKKVAAKKKAAKK